MPDVCCATDHAVATQSLGLLFLAGVGISLGHCVGMCGPLLLGVFGSRSDTRLRDVLGYHSGRITTYALIGACAGLVTAAGGALGGVPFSPALSVVVGMLVVAGALGAGVSRIPALSPLSSWLARRSPASRVMRWARGRGPFALGLANGFLPCGPVYLVALAASTTSHPAASAASMAVYGLGTVPALVILSLGARRVGASVRMRLAHAGTGFLVLLGAQLGLRGLASMGVVGHAAIGRVVLW